MIGLELIHELVEIVVWSGQLLQERPLSLILVAPAGSGKTSVLEMFECRTAHFFSDLTSREVKTVLSNSPDLTHLLIGDFLSIFGHNKSTVKLTINLIARLTGENIKQMPWTGEEIKPRKMGIVTAIPPDDLNRRDVRAHVRTGGFASRFLIANYNYSQLTIERVHRFIRQGKYRNQRPFTCDVKVGAMRVDIPSPIAERVSMLAIQVKRDPIGFRAHHHLRTLIMAIARREGASKVTVKHYEKLVELCDFFNEKGKVI